MISIIIVVIIIIIKMIMNESLKKFSNTRRCIISENPDALLIKIVLQFCQYHRSVDVFACFCWFAHAVERVLERFRVFRDRF